MQHHTFFINLILSNVAAFLTSNQITTAYLPWKFTVRQKVFKENQQVYNFCWNLLASYTKSNTQNKKSSSIKERIVKYTPKITIIFISVRPSVCKVQSIQYSLVL